MCTKHEPILVYGDGGKQTICAKCGLPMNKWQQNGNGEKHNHKVKKNTVHNVQPMIK